MNSVPHIRQWNHIRIHFYEFRFDFTIFFMTLNSYMNSWKLNSCMISWLWIHLNEFIYEFIHTNFRHDFTIIFMIMNSYINTLYGFIYEFMIVNSYTTIHVLWIHIWNHVYEEFCEIIPEIMCTKVSEAELFIFSPVTPVLVQVQVDSLPVVLISGYFWSWHTKSIEVWTPPPRAARLSL